MTNFKDLSERNIILLTMGAHIEGTFVKGYSYVEEKLYIDEAEDLYDFCEWIDNEVGGASEDNIKILYRCWKNPNDPVCQAFVAGLRTKIAEINILVKKHTKS